MEIATVGSKRGIDIPMLRTMLVLHPILFRIREVCTDMCTEVGSDVQLKTQGRRVEKS